MKWGIRIAAGVLSLLLFSTSLSAKEQGFASFYAGKFQGRRTANGEVFDTNQMTAAHKSLAFNSVVKVTNLQNQKSVIVRINDRGPFIEGRIIDLSRAAAEEIDMVGMGVAPVLVEIIKPGDGKTYHHLAIAELVTIQVGSFGIKENAERVKQTLESLGFTPSYETPRENITRVVLRDISISEVLEVKARLQGVGFFNVLVKKQ